MNGIVQYFIADFMNVNIMYKGTINAIHFINGIVWYVYQSYIINHTDNSNTPVHLSPNQIEFYLKKISTNIDS